MQPIDPTVTNDAPEWAHRLLTVNETCRIVRESRSSVYRKIATGVYPPLVKLGGSSRMPGWELWSVIMRLIHGPTTSTDPE